MKHLVRILVVGIVLLSGCTKDIVDQPIANKQPKTFLWLFPDSTIAEGHSKQHIRWWGEDADGIITGYLFASDSIKEFLPASVTTWLDTVSWRWTTLNDSIVAFPLLVKRDTFQVAVRAVDNTQPIRFPDHALIRFVPSGTNPAAYDGPPFWDVNENGQFDIGDVALYALPGAVDQHPATLGMPVLNQPPTIVYAQDPNDPSHVMNQPETTFTAATFAWVGSDPDGDQTIDSYEIALNDTSNPAGWLTLPSSVRLVSLVVPRSRSNPITGVQEVDADVWSGTFITTRRFQGTIPHLKLDTLNNFFVRARDIAGDVSKFIRMPADSTRRWFVKNPKGRLLIVDDYIASDGDAALRFYRDTIFAQVGFPNPNVLDIGAGLSAQQKRDTRFGKFVPPFTDPALIFTFQLFDVVFWYTDQNPSLGVAQVPLYKYVQDPSFRGKVIFTTMFENTSDPRGAITDFAPLDSVSSVNLVNSRLLPTSGDTRMPGGFSLLPDSSNPSDIYPTLTFGTAANYSVYLRPIYKGSNSEYIYHIQPDVQSPIRYTYLVTQNDFRAIAAIGQNAWACGVAGMIYYTSDAGVTWTPQVSRKQTTLESVQFFDVNHGWIIGDRATILNTSDGGQSWIDHSYNRTEHPYGVFFPNVDSGVIVGSSGFLIRTTDKGANWGSVNVHSNRDLRGVHFFDPKIGIIVGDSGLVLKTTDGGTSWRSIFSLTVRRLFGVRFIDSTTVIAVGANGTVLRSINAGESWSPSALGGAPELHSIYSFGNTAWTCGINGTVFHTLDGGLTWIPDNAGISQPPPTNRGQILNGVSFSDASSGWVVGTGGIILHTTDGSSVVSNANWTIQPRGNINVGVIDGVGVDGHRSFVFLGLPLHYLNNPASPNVLPFLQHVIHDEFGK